MISDELFDEAIEIANEIREKNNKRADEIADEIFEGINIDEYKNLGTSVIVGVYIREGRDVYSLGGHYRLKTSKGWNSSDVHEFLIKTEEMYKELKDEE